MIRNQILVFLLRWLFSSFGMWICISLFGQFTRTPDVWLFVLAGLIFSIVNTVVKPFLTMLSLPFIVLTLGLFTLILNIAMIGLTIALTPGVNMGFGGACLSTLVMSLINSLANLLVPAYNKE